MSRITVINDSPEFLDVMNELVTSLGHQMTGLQAIQTSIDEVAETAPDLLMVDLHLDNPAQEISGWELLLLVRSHRSYLRNVPVILSTADVWQLKHRAGDLERIAGVHVRVKPFDLDEMCNLMQRLLGVAETEAQAPILGESAEAY